MSLKPIPSITRPSRALGRVVACVCAALLFGPAAAQASPRDALGNGPAGSITTIGFDDVPDGTAIRGQYTSQGVTFIDGASFPEFIGGSGSPVATATPLAHSGPNAASLYAQCRTEFCTPGVAAQLASFASFVRVYFGSISGRGASASTVTLTAYDSSLHQIGQQTAALPGDVTTPLEVDAPSAEIAYFTVQANDSNVPLAIDDLSYDTPAAPLPPDFQISLSTPSPIIAYPGAGGSEPINVQRFNNSTGPIAFSAPDLPPGWTASVSPNPDGGTAGTATVTITPAPNAATGDTDRNVTIDAVPESPTAGSAERQITIPVRVHPAFGLDSTDASVAPCTSAATVGAWIQGSWPQPVDISVLSPSDASVTPTRLLSSGGFRQPLTITVTHPGQVVLRLTSGAISENVPVTVSSRLSVQTVPSGARSYGTADNDVLITGTGFCSGDLVQFGSESASAASRPNWISADGTRMTVPVTPAASNGPVTVSDGVGTATSAASVSIDSYRNTNGFSFHNYVPHITFGQLTQAFGRDQTYDCPIDDSCFRDPWAIAVSAIADTAFDSAGGGGDCFGFSLGSLRIYSGSLEFAPGKLVDQFPHAGGADVFGIDPAIAAGGTDGPINEYLNAMQASQLSEEFLGHYLSASFTQGIEGGAAATAAIYQQISDSLNAATPDFPQGTYPIIALRDGTSGHVVVAYGLEGTPSDYYIDVYDSNLQFDPQENSNGGLHMQNFAKSRIHVNSDGSWQLPSSGLSGDSSGLVVTRPTDLPQTPTMIGTGLIAKGAVAVLFGSAGAPRSDATTSTPLASKVTQVTDASGKTLLDSSGNLNTDRSSRLDGTMYAPASATATSTAPAPLILLGAGEGAVRETVSDMGTGADTHLLVAGRKLAEVNTQASPGATDQLTLSPGSGTVGYSTDAARKPVTLTVIGGGSVRETATVATTSFHGGTEHIGLTSGGLVVDHRGPATTITVTLATSGAATLPRAFESSTIRMPANGAARLSGIAWRDLGRAAPRLRLGTRTIVLRNHLPRLPRVEIRSLRAQRKAANQTTITATLAAHRLPRGTQLSLQWTVRSASKLIASQTVLTGAGTRTASWTFSGQAGVRYAVTVAATPVQTVHGTTQAAAPAIRTVSIAG